MSLDPYHHGLAGLGLILVPALALAWRTTGDLLGAARGVGVGVVALAELTVASLALGLTGALSVTGLGLVQLFVLGAALLVPMGRPARTPPSADAPHGPPLPLAALAPVAAVLGPAGALGVVRALLAPPTNWDSLAYHLPFVTRWLATGSLTGLVSLPGYPGQVGYFPAGAELCWFWVLAPWRSDFAAGAVNAVLLALCGVAIAALAGRLGATAAAGALGAGVFALVPLTFSSLFGTANVDLYVTFTFLASALFLASPGPGNLWRGGLAAGLLLGSKYSALVLAPVLCGFAVAARAPGSGAGAVDPRRVRLPLLGALALGGFWYVRNGHATGNPIWPLPLGVPGLRLPSGTIAASGRFLDSAGDPAAQRALAEAVWAMFGLAAPALALGWLAHAGLALRDAWRGRPDRALHLAVVGAGAALAALWPLLPGTALYHAYNLRYLLPAVGLLAVSAAVALARSALARSPLAARRAPSVTARAALPAPSDAAPAALPTLAAAFFSVQLVLCAPHLALPAVWTLFALVLAALGLGLVRAALHRRTLAVVVALGLLDLAGARLYQAHHDPRTRYAWFLADYQGGRMRMAAEWADAQVGARIALAGPLPPYFLAGSGFQNRVECLSVEASGARYPHEVAGGELRRAPDREAWRRSVAAFEPDFLVVSRHGVDAAYPPEDDWARAEPGRFALERADGAVRIYRVRTEAP